MESKITAFEASRPGALPGFEWKCDCGTTIRSSLESSLRFEIVQHVAWHGSKAKRVGAVS